MTKLIPKYQKGKQITYSNPQLLDNSTLSTRLSKVVNTNKEGEYNPFYSSLDDTYGTVPLQEIKVTAPLTEKAQRKIEARRGESYVDAGRRKAAPYIGAIVGGAALGAMGSAGMLSQAITPIDIGFIYQNPKDPLNYLPAASSIVRSVNKLKNSNLVRSVALSRTMNNSDIVITPNKITPNKIQSISQVPTVENTINYNDAKRTIDNNLYNEYLDDFAKEQYAIEADKQKYVRDQLKLFNQFGKHYGYSPVDLNLSKKVEFADEAVKEVLQQHNTFVRGVRDVRGKELEDINSILIQRGIEPTFENRLKFFATTYAPQTGAGRAGFRGYDENIGTIYTSNSYDTAAGYAADRSGILHNYGRIAKVRRPVDLSGSLLDGQLPVWLKNADFEFDNKYSTNWYKYQLPYKLKTGKSLRKDIIDEIGVNQINYDDFKQAAINTLTVKYGDPEQNLGSHYLNTFNKLISNSSTAKKYKVSSNFSKNIYRSAAKQKIVRDFVRDVLVNTNNLPLNSEKVAEYVEKNIGSFFNRKNYDKELKQVLTERDLRIKDLIKQNRLEAENEIRKKFSSKLKQYNIQPFNDKSNIITTENLTRTTRNTKDPYQHFIFVGPIGEQGLDFIEFIDPLKLDLTKRLTRQHVGRSGNDLSRKSYQNGGKLIKRPIPKVNNCIDNLPLE